MVLPSASPVVASETNTYLSLIAFSVLYYDYFLTIVPEIELFWFKTGKRRWTAASILFFFHRYLAILGHIPLVYETVAPAPGKQVCGGLTNYHQYHIFASQSATSILCIMRVSALYNHHRGVIGFLCAIIVCIVAASCMSVFAWRPQSSLQATLTESLPGCLVFYTSSEALALSLTWGGVMLFDIAIFGLSVYKGRTLDWRNPWSIAHVLLRDGAVYFLVLFVLNLANILGILLAPPLLKGISPVVINVLSTTLMSRFMINLRIEHARFQDRPFPSYDIERPPELKTAGVGEHCTEPRWC
ncbi:hypothetical protein FA95DRAFT_1560913 [Auriscalpium vulgare]|uniref:Uncharacterized protein n=1 Tax=Auriscalpium vulgare TaxID=40419 RepID=A0ACB8RN87_9AGAM|nr:hypothetical protein FA95DRAFT_1560913 [Auriscalpium vulgare]